MRETPHDRDEEVQDEELQIANALRQLAAETRPPHPLPTAGQIWWRAEVARRLAGKPDGRVDRALRPATWGQRAGLAVLLAFFALEVPALLESLGQRIVLGAPLPLVLAGLLPLAAAVLLGLLARRT
jgi:hypothetical protein